MIVFAREVYACRCGTDVPDDDPGASDLARRVRIERGSEADLALLDREHHDDAHLEELRGRLARSELWIVGRLDDRIVHYFWLTQQASCSYPSLPGCTFSLDADTGYGYDAWTHPELRGSGIRRRTFLEEMHLLKELGKRYEASFFVAYQLEGATRSLGKVGIVVEPVWRITLQRDRTLRFDPMLARDETMRPAPVANGQIIRGSPTAA